MTAGPFVAAAALFVCAALWTRPANAAESLVTAAASPVRTAPFDVAPLLARVHAGDKLVADEQPQGLWRRVQLPDGRWGFMRDADVKVAVPPAPPPAAAGSKDAAGAAGPPAKLTAKVGVLELGVRGAPAADAPVLKMLRQDAEVVVSSEASDGWRRVDLPDGQEGYVADAGLKVDAGAPPAAVAAPGLAPPAAPIGSSPPVVTQPPGDAEPTEGPTLFGVIFEMLPFGTLSATASSGTQTSALSSDSVFALAVAPFLDVPLSPFFTLGASPQVILRVKGEGATGESATEFDLRARLTARAPVSPNARLYARLSPAYSIISLPSPPLAAQPPPDPKGFLLDVAVGTEVQLVPNLFLVVDLGYQFGFQSASVTENGVTTDLDLHSRYLHLGGGLAMGL